jgi:VanZ family protein
MFFRYNLGAFSWAAIILVLCITPGDEMPDLSFWELFTFDKAAHTTVFAILVFQLAMGFYKQYSFRILRYHALQAATIAGIIYGGLLELLQQVMFAGRHGDILDFIANCAGCLVGSAVFHLLFKNIYLR